MKVLELFSGYGSQSLALKRMGIEHESHISEIDKYAVQAYTQIHGHTWNLGDICEIDESKLPYYDLITYSSPCQDFSTAGKQAGGEKGSGTRSSLLWECERIIREVKPKYLLLENVKALVNKKNKPNFDAWLNTLDEMGYNNYWQVLNAKDYGVPQNRERVFVVSIRKDIEQTYTFPEKTPLGRRLKDVLELKVDEKYYLSDEKVARFLQSGNVNPSGRGMNGQVNTKDISDTLTTNKGEGAKIIIDDTQGFETEPRIYDKYAPTIRASRSGLKVMQVDNLKEPKILQTPRGYQGLMGVDDSEFETNVGHHPFSKKLEFNGFKTDCSPCLLSTDYKCPKCTLTKGLRIRKLTPRECWRLMGVDDSDFDKLQGISNSQLYKLAGNSIVVDVLVAIFRNLL